MKIHGRKTYGASAAFIGLVWLTDLTGFDVPDEMLMKIAGTLVGLAFMGLRHAMARYGLDLDQLLQRVESVKRDTRTQRLFQRADEARPRQGFASWQALVACAALTLLLLTGCGIATAGKAFSMRPDLDAVALAPPAPCADAAEVLCVPIARVLSAQDGMTSKDVAERGTLRVADDEQKRRVRAHLAMGGRVKGTGNWSATSDPAQRVFHPAELWFTEDKVDQDLFASILSLLDITTILELLQWLTTD